MATNSKPRMLCLCFDGTSNEFNDENTNVVKFFSLLKKDDLTEQLCYYQPGIGTFFTPGLVSPMFEWAAKLADCAVAWYLDAHVMDGYRFLMSNYCVGDKICIFGFSRGAYSARALAGMLYKVGLLPKDNNEQIAFAYRFYKRTDKAGIKLSAGFKRTFSQDVVVEFVGVWDTVAGVGIIKGRSLPFTDSNRSIKTFRHALALDERRAKFRPNLYHRVAPDAFSASHDLERGIPVIQRNSPSSVAKKIRLSKGFKFFRHLSLKRKQGLDLSKSEDASSSDAVSIDDLKDDVIDTDVLEVWFPGDHCDVGGGWVTNDTRHALSQVTLHWMVRQVIASGCGVLFDQAALSRCGIPKGVFSDTPSPNPREENPELDQNGGVQAVHDMLRNKPGWWWLLEIIPMPFSWQDEAGAWHTDYGPHMGKGRHIRTEHPNFHVTVKQRMNSRNSNYKPKAQWKTGNEIYVE